MRRLKTLPQLDINNILSKPPYSDNPGIDQPLFPDFPVLGQQ